MRVRTYIAALLLLMPALCHGVPAARKARTVIQPDGTALTVYTAGDERAHFHITEDGKMVAPGIDGEWKYVSTVIDGIAMPGKITAHNPEYRTPSEKAYASRIDQARLADKFAVNRDMRPSDLLQTKGSVQTAPGKYSVTSLPPFGEVPGLIVLVDFPDRKFSMSDSLAWETFNRRYNEEGYSQSQTFKGTLLTATGSVRDYFVDQSFGQFTPRFDVIGPITAKNGYAYYGNNGKTGKDDSKNAQKLVIEILDYISQNKLADLSSYDSDNNRELDFMGIIYAGNGENYVSDKDPDCIWPHQWYLSKRIGTLQAFNYFMTCELLWDSKTVLDGIGCFCHEFSHALGLPDFYYSGYALGAWSIMDYGSYNNEGYTPAGYLAFERYSLNWIDIPTLTSAGSYRLGQFESDGMAYRITPDGREHTPKDPYDQYSDQFIIIENHSKQKWNASHAGQGLLVTAVSYNYSNWYNNTPNTTATKGYAVVTADGNIGQYTQSSDLYPYGKKDSLTMYSTPALQIDRGPYITTGLYKISKEPDNSISFSYGLPATDISPVATVQTVITPLSGGRVMIEAPAGSAITVHSLGGIAAIRQTAAETETILELPGEGTWLVSCNGKTEKVRF